MLKKIMLVFALSLILVSPLFGASYKIDNNHSEVGFTVDHLMIFKVTGYFSDFAGTIEADVDNKTLSATKATIQTTSIDTRIDKRDEHLRSADFFDVGKYPVITFQSEKVEGSGSNIKLHGTLTIRDITQPVVLTGAFLGQNTDAWGNVRVGFAAKGKINRKDFGLTWNKALEAGGVTVGDEVELTLQIQGVKS